ncbi:Hydroxyneurosporene synthase (CrtC) [Posidoniimonas polymericola]|uniref:Hydroxyneurosporene synthase (CrtC) n=1 Tax=Posidoniimonas polymericola TaxID=2528002 RepID=A0A5C5YTN4_9BACT|nr:lipocalin-like domain-containing protein [Posidoniimonas polymericola]TWT78374.1 Hydroxyneurosporene synthase (CrtC) [Posidoniimonas polymericola]
MANVTLVLGVALSIAALVGCSNDRADIAPSTKSLLDESTATPAEGQADAAWAKALQPREFNFPADHGAHSDYRIEWWYFTGNLTTPTGRRFGYQLTFFRTGMLREPENPSRWVVRDLYTAHFAVSDIRAEKHSFAQRTRRAGIDAAGAATGRPQVWNGDWRVEAEGDTHRLTAQADDFAIDLALEPGKGVVLQGAGGLSQKGAAEGNASHYYSMPRMPTAGTLTVHGETFSVTGDSWMDHEFSTSFLEPGQRGWDWLSLQLDDNSELMLYQMRRSDGSFDPYSSGSFVGADGASTELRSTDFRLTPGKTWRSEATGARYPLSWQVEVDSLGLKLQVTPAFKEQEMATEATTGIAYWEGAMEVSGSRGARPIAGRGYLELTGYTETELGSLLGR